MTTPSLSLHRPEFETGSCGVGFVAHLRGEKSTAIVRDALSILARLSHRGAVCNDPDSGDGAGILLQLPHRFFKREGLALGIEVPSRRGYGIGQVFLPSSSTARAAVEQIIHEVVAEEGQRVLGSRSVPIDSSVVGPVARASLPVMRQLYVGRRRLAPSAFERVLYVIRKRIERRVRDELSVDDASGFHVASLSSETIVYKGLTLPERLGAFYPDLSDVDMVSGLAVVHSRFATNTKPSWDLAQPLRVIAHNGEINTVSGNRAWITARRRLLQSAKFPGGIDRLWPILEPGKSDSMSFDNILELLVLGGRSLPHALMMMIPEAWEHDVDMPDDRRAFYEYAGSLLEPWDGPAAVVFTDGLTIGATVDRNGLRPARYVVTSDDRVILSSEAGVLDLPPEQIVRRGRLQPGRMFLVDTEEGRILEDDDVKHEIVSRYPYRRWLDKNAMSFDDLPACEPPTPTDDAALLVQQRAFGWVDDDVDSTVMAMAVSGKEPIGSMGNDAPIAALSEKAPPLFDFFHQRFAQVTNPPIDPLRERLVMTLTSSVGPDGNTLDETPEQCHHLPLPGPVLNSRELQRLKAVHDDSVFEARTLSLLYPLKAKSTVDNTVDNSALEAALVALCDAAVAAVDDGNTIVVLSDRGVDETHVALPSLLALSAVQQRLVREGIRTHVGIVVEAGDVREVHHVACLLGFGAAAVNPWLAIDTIKSLVRNGRIEGTQKAAIDRFIDAIDDGVLKIMSKLGISTLQSYRGAQLFEAIGIDADVVDRFFTNTPARLGGLSLTRLHQQLTIRHAQAFVVDAPRALPVGGLYVFKRDGERHRWDPFTVKALQKAARTGDDPALWEAFRALADNDNDDLAPAALRDLLSIAGTAAPVALDEVEPASSIVRRFGSGAMSLGALSPEAHETLAIAMNRIGGKSNCGEGGEEAHRDIVDDNGDDRRSYIRQVASGRFGVTLPYLTGARELQIKIAQGAKPGEGGQLPGEKVDARIAAVRHSTPGVTLISPPPHHDIYSIEDLKQLIFDLQSVNPDAGISVKLVAQAGIGVVAAGVVKAGAGSITISGFEGGTGASPLSSLKHAGVPWELGLAEARQVLTALQLRQRVRLQVDGGLRTGRDVVIAALLGADEMGLATSALVAAGCVMMRKCHLNSCGVGVATQDPKLRAKYPGKADHVVNYFMWVAEDVRRVMAQLGVRRFDELVGRVDLLTPRTTIAHAQARAIDVQPLLSSSSPAVRGPGEVHRVDVSQHKDHAWHAVVDEVVAGRVVEVEGTVRNTDRAVGTWLSGAIARRGGAGPGGHAVLSLRGSAGQSFGAFLAAGVSLRLVGEANDGVGKGLAGGEVVIARPPNSGSVDDVLVGNVALYGATAGALFVAGRAGERFAVRNSGAVAVVAGVGDHGCEYMTGGTVVVLGAVGRNFGAGMSGGRAFVVDDGTLSRRVHRALLVHEISEAERVELDALLARYERLTGVVVDEQQRAALKKVVSPEYLKALAAA
jgi:glutamate synthase (NADPH/NADH) large chain